MTDYNDALTENRTGFIRIERDEIPIIDCAQSMDGELLETLLECSKCIYVESANHVLEGIISRGDFGLKYKSGNHVNRRFCFVCMNDDVLKEATRLCQEKDIYEIPVLGIHNDLLYVLRKKEDNIILSFDFDWDLCDIQWFDDFLSTFQNIYYMKDNNKIRGLRGRMTSFADIRRIEDCSICKEKDLLICDKTDISCRGRICSIDEIYLTAIAASAVRRLMAKEIKYYFFQTPVENKLRKENKIYLKQKVWNREELLPVYENDVQDMEYWLLGDWKKVKFGEIGKRYLPLDVKSKTYNVVDNQRVTCFQPKDYQQTIWVLGTCIARGYGVSDRMTIPSILQKRLLDEGYDKYIVRNLGTGGGLNLYADIRDFVNILRSDTKSGDIIIHIGYNCWELDYSKVEFDEYYELSWLFNKKHDRRCFLSGAPHLTPYANRIVSEYIYENICKSLCFR